MRTKIKFFPAGSYRFTLIDSQIDTLARLTRRTATPQNRASAKHSISFVGKVEGNSFELVSAQIGRGSLCILTGRIEDQSRIVTVRIRQTLRVLLGIFYLFPIFGIISEYSRLQDGFPPILFLVCILQILMIRFFFLEIFFRMTSRRLLEKLQDVVDVKSFEKI